MTWKWYSSIPLSMFYGSTFRILPGDVEFISKKAITKNRKKNKEKSETPCMCTKIFVRYGLGLNLRVFMSVLIIGIDGWVGRGGGSGLVIFETAVLYFFLPEVFFYVSCATCLIIYVWY